ncbi:MAG: hypothetical protein GF317_04825 [Candidatus Lokiarchaeota archaeon]|nr:hypothetical protein [Candidatus Lokiarchaeota archaeon]
MEFNFELVFGFLVTMITIVATITGAVWKINNMVKQTVEKEVKTVQSKIENVNEVIKNNVEVICPEKYYPKVDGIVLANKIDIMYKQIDKNFEQISRDITVTKELIIEEIKNGHNKKEK